MILAPAAAEKNTKSATVRNKVFLSLLSGVLLFLSYPPFSLGFLAWVAFIPLFFALKDAPSRRTAFFLGTLTGFAFFFVSIQWLVHVTPVGWLLLASFEALFMGLFAWTFPSLRGAKGDEAISKRRLPRPFGARNDEIFRIVWISLAWTATEFLRAKFPVLGFGWNLLGYSQAFYETVIQSANVLGVYGLGFGVMGVNVALYQTLDTRHETRDLKPKPQKSSQKFSIFSLVSRVSGLGSRVSGLGSMVFIFALVFSHGLYHKARAGEHRGDFRISVIQGNIPQSVKWEAMARDEIIQIYTKLTELAALEEPSLIIWPEAAFPGYFNRDFDAQLVEELAQKIEIPILVGAPHWEQGSPLRSLATAQQGDKAFNSAYLLGADGEIKKRYDKQILVPFGEYVPMDGALAWLAPYAYALGVSDFSAGHEKTVLDILNHEVTFSVLICFEDIFPELAREFVNRGAQFLTVITNDAWFGHSGAAAQHLQASIFRAVENGVPVVRAANTGISAFISNRGQVLGRVADKKGHELFVTGRKTMALPLEIKPTFFRKAGWVFPYVASGVFVIMLIVTKVKGKRQKVKGEK